MPVALTFTAAERERIGVLINNISIYVAQILSNTAGTNVTTRALANIAKVRRENEDMLRRLDEFAREHFEESPLRLIEDLPRVPLDVAGLLTLVRRCAMASAFLGHCLAQPTDPEPAASGAVQNSIH